MTSAVAHDLTSSVSEASEQSARLEIRKKRNRDSARRSRERRAANQRDVYECVEAQTERVRALDERIAMLEALVNDGKPRRRARSKRAYPSHPPAAPAPVAPTPQVIPPAPTCKSNAPREEIAVMSAQVGQCTGPNALHTGLYPLDTLGMDVAAGFPLAGPEPGLHFSPTIVEGEGDPQAFDVWHPSNAALQDPLLDLVDPVDSLLNGL